MGSESGVGLPTHTALGDTSKVKYVPHTARQRFTAFQSGEIHPKSERTKDFLSKIPGH